MNVLAKAVDIVILWHGCLELQELVLKDEHAAFCAEENIT